MEESAAGRRERLQALRDAQKLVNTPDDPSDEEGERSDNEDVKVKFRNYLPHDKQLQEGKLTPPVLPKFQQLPPPADDQEDPFLNIAPKKPNWDLRRDVQKKLDKLEKRTQKAMRNLMEEEEKRRRLAEEGASAED